MPTPRRPAPRRAAPRHPVTAVAKHRPSPPAGVNPTAGRCARCIGRATRRL